MVTLEQVEKLREHASVSYEEAKAALEECDGDLLDALVYLERKGRVKGPDGGGSYNSQGNSADAQEQAPPQPETRRKEQSSGSSGNCGKKVNSLWKTFCELLHKGTSNHFEASRNGNLLVSLPVIVLVFLLLFTFWITLPLMIIGLFFGCTYAFRGPDLGRDSVNNIVNSAAEVAEDIKKTFTKGETQDHI